MAPGQGATDLGRRLLSTAACPTRLKCQCDPMHGASRDPRNRRSRVFQACFWASLNVAEGWGVMEEVCRGAGAAKGSVFHSHQVATECELP